MTQLSWNQPGERFFETGLDRGVLYVDSVGVAWNGLTAVNETPSGGEATPYYMDGVKFLNVSAYEEFQATIQAFTYPKEFDQCNGIVEITTGFYVDQQPRKAFGFAYRTRIGNDLQGTDHGYKIHIVYDALAEPTESNFETLSDEIEPAPFSWTIKTTPPAIEFYRASSHFVIDSRQIDPDVLIRVEEMLYGTEETDAHLPSVLELIDLIAVEYRRTNRAMNPNMVKLGSFLSPPISRINSNVNPYFIGLGAPNVAGSTGTWTDATTNGPLGFNNRRRVYQMTVLNTSSPISLDLRGSHASTRIGVVPGQTVTLSGYAYKNLDISAARTARIEYTFYNASSVVVGSPGNGTAVAMTNTVWARPFATVVVPATAATVAVTISIIGTGGTLGGGTLAFSEGLVETEDELMPALSGTNSVDPRLSAFWAGTANASITAGLAVGIPLGGGNFVSRSDLPSANSVSTASGTIISNSPLTSHVGNDSGCIIPNGTAAVSYVDIYGNPTALPLLPGKTYRISTWLRRLGVMRTYKGIAPDAIHSRISAFYKDPGLSTFTRVDGSQGPNSNAEALSSLEIVVPEDSEGGYIRVVNGSANPSDPLWFDCLIIEDITDFVPPDDTFFDGNTVNTGTEINAWVGVANESMSTQTVYFVTYFAEHFE